MLQIIKKCILCLFSLVYQVIAQLIIQQYFVAKAMPFLYHIMAYSRRGFTTKVFYSKTFA